MIVVDVVIIISIFSLFAISHSLLASNKIKKALAEKLGEKIALYRVFYNLSSVIIFTAAYTIAPKLDVVIYDLQYPFDIITFAFQIIALVGFIWAAKPVNLMEFIGISQIERYLRGSYNIDDLDEKQTLKIEGAFKFVRHPLYFFSILFLALRPTMSLFYLVMFICLTVYFYVGSIYEERKLVKRFGDEYREYQKNVPRIIPIKLRKPKYD